jgi:hypothetical protein
MSPATESSGQQIFQGSTHRSPCRHKPRKLECCNKRKSSCSPTPKSLYRRFHPLFACARQSLCGHMYESQKVHLEIPMRYVRVVGRGTRGTARVRVCTCHARCFLLHACGCQLRTGFWYLGWRDLMISCADTAGGRHFLYCSGFEL